MVDKPKVKTFQIQCKFHGNYDEPKLTMAVSMEKLRLFGSVTCEMVFHVPAKTFESVRMIKSDTG